MGAGGPETLFFVYVVFGFAIVVCRAIAKGSHDDQRADLFYVVGDDVVSWDDITWCG